MRPLVSVVIPAHNVERYVGKTLKSVFEQDFQNFEVIVVNDGSTDRTDYVIKKILRRFAEERSDIKVKYIPLLSNKGVSVARNVGLDNSEGDFIVFLDGDDMMAEGNLSKLYEAITKTEADMAWGWFVVVDEKGSYIGEDARKFIPNRVISGQEILTHIFLRHSWIAMWAAIYKKELIKSWKIRFTPGAIRAQDLEFNFKYLFHSKKVFGIRDVVMKYVQRPDSVTKSADKRVFHILATYQRLKKYFERNGASESFLNLFWNVFFASVFYLQILIPVAQKGSSETRRILKALLKMPEGIETVANIVNNLNIDENQIIKLISMI